MVSNPSMQFMLYETLLKKVKERRAMKKTASNSVTALEIFLLGAVAKLGATVVTYPLLVVKSRLQAKQVAGTDKRHHYEGHRGRPRGGYGREDYGHRRSPRRSPYRGGRGYSPRRSPYAERSRRYRSRSYSPYGSPDRGYGRRSGYVR